MKHTAIPYYFNQLQNNHYKSFWLAFLRVAISLWLLKEVCINWSSMELLYGPSSFVVPRPTLIDRLPGGSSLIKNYYPWFIGCYIVVILMNIMGAGRWVTALLLFIMVYVLKKMNTAYVNGGDVMVKFVLFYLVFANSYQYFVLIKQKIRSSEKEKFQNLLSNLAAFSIMLQLCLAYFLTGLAKLNDPYWLNGEGSYYALSIDRFIGTPYNKWLLQHQWFNLLTNYSILAFELLFPFLIWFKKLRKPLLIGGIIFHAAIYILMMIYGFQVVFVLLYGMFLPNDRVLAFAKKVRGYFLKTASPA